MTRRRLLHLAAAAALALAACIVLALVPLSPLRHLDAAAPAAGHELLVHATVLRGTVRTVTDLGSPIAVDLLTGVACVLLLAVRRWRAALAVAVARPGEVATGVLLKATVHRPRPALLPQLTSAGGAGFPSGHTAGSAAVYGILAIVVGTWLSVSARRRLLAAVAVWVGLVAASRVLLGVHYPTDVLGGAALGILWLAVALALLPPDSWWEQSVRNRPTDGDESRYLRLT